MCELLKQQQDAYVQLLTQQEIIFSKPARSLAIRAKRLALTLVLCESAMTTSGKSDYLEGHQNAIMQALMAFQSPYGRAGRSRGTRCGLPTTKLQMDEKKIEVGN